MAETVKGVNYYFSVSSIEPVAAKVNGLSVAMLKELSFGQTFADSFNQIAEDLRGGEIIAHNALFDISMLKQEFIRNVSIFRPSSVYCTMEAFKSVMRLKFTSGAFFKNPSLSELTNYRGIDVSDILSLGSRLFNCSQLSAHDARYDVTALYLLYFAGPLPSLSKSAGNSSPNISPSQKSTFSAPSSPSSSSNSWKLTSSLISTISFPDEFWTVTQFLQFVYSFFQVPADQRLLSSRLLTELHDR